MRAGLEVGIITSRESMVVTHRARNLGIELVYQGVLDKPKAFEEILRKRPYSPEETAYMGENRGALPLLKRVGFSAAVADAVDEVREMVDYVTRSPGGKGA